MRIIATVARSAGNESVGDMWHETKIFDDTDTLKSVYEWAETLTNVNHTDVVLTVGQ